MCKSDFEEFIGKGKEAQEVSEPKEKVPKKYEKKLVAVLDLLGITQDIRDSEKENVDESEILSVLDDIKGIVDAASKDLEEIDDLSVVYQISDSFIFVCEESALEEMIGALSIVQKKILVDKKRLLRGALEYGSIYIDSEKKQVFGPAFIKAYLCQENEAIYPRIIIGDSVKKLDSYSKLKDLRWICHDDEEIIDYIGFYGIDEFSKEIKEKKTCKFLEEKYESYSREDKLNIRQKYAWTKDYFKTKGVLDYEK